MGNLATPASVQKLQMALHAKAKTEAGFRFYALYDKMYREDILTHAYAQCRANKGAPGVDGQDFSDVETYGLERWLGELATALKEKTYRPEPIRRVFIPKPNGKLRPLGVAACNRNMPGSQSAHFPTQINCGQATRSAHIICEPACNRCRRLAIHRHRLTLSATGDGYRTRHENRLRARCLGGTTDHSFSFAAGTIIRCITTNRYGASGTVY